MTVLIWRLLAGCGCERVECLGSVEIGLLGVLLPFKKRVRGPVIAGAREGTCSIQEGL